MEYNVTLKGTITDFKITEENHEPVKMEIILSVPIRSDSMSWNSMEEFKYDNVSILVRDPRQMKYLSDEHVAEGNILEVSGVYSRIMEEKHFFCPTCKEINFYEESSAYIVPTSLKFDESCSEEFKRNRIFVTDRVVSDPVPVKEKSGKICAIYELEGGVSVMSCGEQAENDLKRIGKGSVIFVNGSLRAAEGITTKRMCGHCGTECSVEDDPIMYVTADSVEYLTNCNERESEKHTVTMSEYAAQFGKKIPDFEETENVYNDYNWDDDDDWNDPYPDWVEERFGSDIPDWAHDRWG